MKKKTKKWVQIVSLIGCLVLGGFSTSSKGAEGGLLDAADAGDLARVKSLIAAGSDVNGKDKDGVTALSKASLSGHVEVVRALLAAKADVNAKSNDGGTALMFGSASGSVEVVRALLAAGADVNAKSKNGGTALMAASNMSLDERAEMLSKLLPKLDIGEPAKTTGKNQQENINKSHVEMVRALLKAGSDVNAKNKDGYTALMCASTFGYVEAVRALLEAKADVNARNKDGDTALKIASAMGHAEVVKLLKLAGATK